MLQLGEGRAEVAELPVVEGQEAGKGDAGQFGAAAEERRKRVGP